MEHIHFLFCVLCCAVASSWSNWREFPCLSLNCIIFKYTIYTSCRFYLRRVRPATIRNQYKEVLLRSRRGSFDLCLFFIFFIFLFFFFFSVHFLLIINFSYSPSSSCITSSSFLHPPCLLLALSTLLSPSTTSFPPSGLQSPLPFCSAATQLVEQMSSSQEVLDLNPA